MSLLQMEQSAALTCAWPGLNSPFSFPAELCSCSANEVHLLFLSKSSGDPFPQWDPGLFWKWISLRSKAMKASLLILPAAKALSIASMPWFGSAAGSGAGGPALSRHWYLRAAPSDSWHTRSGMQAFALLLLSCLCRSDAKRGGRGVMHMCFGTPPSLCWSSKLLSDRILQVASTQPCGSGLDADLCSLWNWSGSAAWPEFPTHHPRNLASLSCDLVPGKDSTWCSCNVPAWWTTVLKVSDLCAAVPLAACSEHTGKRQWHAIWLPASAIAFPPPGTGSPSWVSGETHPGERLTGQT